MENNQYDWVDFYREFAYKLLEYKNNRKELIEKIINIYKEIGINLPTLETDNNIIDIDPFTIFGLFNKKITYENRTKILSAIAKNFWIQSNIPSAFDSIPVLNNQNATYYYFIGDRGQNDIDDLWELFEAALHYANDPNEWNKSQISKYFDIVINKKGIGNSKLTMALYWIAPHAFLNLDQRNTWYIYDSGKLPKELVDTLPEIEAKIPAEKYFYITEKLREYLNNNDNELKDFKDLSFEAWRYSEQVNQEIKAETEKKQREEKGAGLADNDVDTVHYWIFAPGDKASKWDEFYESEVMAIGWSVLGDLRQYESKEDMKQKMKELINPDFSYKNDAHATWEFANKIKPGDIVFAKKGMHTIVGRGIVTSDYIYDSSRNDDFKNVRQINWTNKGEWKCDEQLVLKTLTDITPYTTLIEKLNSLIEVDSEEDIIKEVERKYPEYDERKFLEEVYISNEDYKTLVGLIRTKKNIILQGAPGVGKTFAAKRLAYSMIGEKNQERVMMIQFHQSYSYEDFIEGFRPKVGEDGFEIKKGAFYNFCKKASNDLDNEYFFIIDEINRGNLSKIFGELFMLIENDKRGNALQLLYSDEKFFVPKNVYIIGMMNTADRSLAMLDYALRRRFAFYEMRPGFNSDGFREYRMQLNSEKFNKLINCVIELNSIIASDESLGEGFCIGHSYFCNLEKADENVLSNIVEYELIPLLKEYWFDEPSKVNDWTEKLRSVIR